MAEQFKWVGFYMEFASRLLEYETDRFPLIEQLQTLYSDLGLKLPKLGKNYEKFLLSYYRKEQSKLIANASRIAWKQERPIWDILTPPSSLTYQSIKRMILI